MILDLFVFHLVVPPKKNDKPDKQLVDVQPMEASNRPRKEHTPGTQNTNMIQDFHN